MADERICAECSHLLGRRTNSDQAESWKCLAKENVVSTSRDLVTGRLIYHLRFETCYDARSADILEDGCGSAGKWFEKYHAQIHGYASEVMSYSLPPKRPKLVAGAEMTADALLAELDNLPGGKK